MSISFETEEREPLFNQIGKSPRAWREQGKLLWISADLVMARFQEILPLSQNISGIQLEKLAFMQSYMMLMGFSMENLIKGAHVALTPELSLQDRLTQWRRHNSGHGISTLITLVLAADADEVDLLKRLETYSVWAGRYPLPTRADEWERAESESLRTLTPTRDHPLAGKIIQRLSDIIESVPEPWF